MCIRDRVRPLKHHGLIHVEFFSTIEFLPPMAVFEGSGLRYVPLEPAIYSYTGWHFSMSATVNTRAVHTNDIRTFFTLKNTSGPIPNPGEDQRAVRRTRYNGCISTAQIFIAPFVNRADFFPSIAQTAK